jgi:hypothetical protein
MSLHLVSAKSVKVRSGLVLGMILFIALVAFETFNYSTTQYALSDLLGNLTFASIPWATILSIAFCGIDFAGIARLFTPGEASNETQEAWYMFGAWLLAATMNAILTWWGVSMAIMNHIVQSTEFVSPSTIIKVVPVFVAVMVWVIRILIIGTISIAIDRFLKRDQPNYSARIPMQSVPVSRPAMSPSPSLAARPSYNRSSPSRYNNEEEEPSSQPEPTYHSVAVMALPAPGQKSPINEPKGRNRSKMI